MRGVSGPGRSKYVSRAAQAGCGGGKEKADQDGVNIKPEARPVFLLLAEATPLSTEVRRLLSNVNPPSWPLCPGYHRHQAWSERLVQVPQQPSRHSIADASWASSA